MNYARFFDAVRFPYAPAASVFVRAASRGWCECWPTETKINDSSSAAQQATLLELFS
jgi:hypothetical protein